MRRRTASRTALKVAWGLWFAGGEADLAGLLPPGEAEALDRLLRAGSRSYAFQRWILTRSWYRWFVRWFLGRCTPGALRYLTLRRRFVYDQVLEAITENADQVIVLGAGLDPLGHLLARERPGVRVFELDHPATQRLRRRALTSNRWEGVAPVLVPVDLERQSWPEVLAQVPEFDQDARAVFVAEGLLMYLSEDAVRSLLRAVAGVGGPGSRLILTHVGRDRRGRPDCGPLASLTRLSLRLMGEPFRWGIHATDLDEFLRSEGLHLREALDSGSLRERYRLGDLPVMEFEHLAVAEVEERPGTP